MSFPGGELEGPRPKVLCPTCRERLKHLGSNPSNPPLCFACYRASVDRDRALRAAGALDTASEARFQSALPFEPVNRSRLEGLRVERAAARVAERAGAGRYIDKRRRAQIAARHALERVVIGLRGCGATKAEQDREVSNVIHAAELQLPEAWLPFVASR